MSKERKIVSRRRIGRKFQEQPKYRVVISDLIYVRVGKNWSYICVFVNFLNREIIGYSAGKK